MNRVSCGDDCITKDKGLFYIAQYPVRCTTQSALHFSSSDLFIPTPTRLLLEDFYPCSNWAYAQRQFTHIPTTGYSQVGPTHLYSWELRRHGENENAKKRRNGSLRVGRYVGTHNVIFPISYLYSLCTCSTTRHYIEYSLKQRTGIVFVT